MVSEDSSSVTEAQVPEVKPYEYKQLLYGALWRARIKLMSMTGKAFILRNAVLVNNIQKNVEKELWTQISDADEDTRWFLSRTVNPNFPKDKKKSKKSKRQ